MQIERILTSQMQTNTYVVFNGDKAFVVDVGGEANEIAQLIEKRGAKLDAILITHAHFDHIGGVAELAKIAPHDDKKPVAIIMHKDDVDKINSYKNMGFAVGAKVEPFEPDVLLSGGETISVAGLDVKVLLTQGHSKGGVCYIVGDTIFCGDTLFLNSYGRTDFYDGSFAELKNSVVNKLFRLNGNYTLLAGHGAPTTLDNERKYNPILFS